MKCDTFSDLVLEWFEKHGRDNFPWQKNITPYRVWVSEIMLQQTQVSTVLKYYDRFLSYAPTVKSLAMLSGNEVLYLWNGLGYYQRAINLHKAAKIVCQAYDSELPRNIALLTGLPGIGLSTAGAIASISMNLRSPILDCNAKRVLARYTAQKGYPGHSKTSKALWDTAERFTPRRRFNEYTQAIMDIGSIVCTRSNPKCSYCPLETRCKARKLERQTDYPESKPRRNSPQKSTRMYVIVNEKSHILLTRRPSYGIWGGLWSFLETENISSLENALERPYNTVFCGKISDSVHIFSHFKLNIEIWTIGIIQKENLMLSAEDHIWYDLRTEINIALAAPTKKIVEEIRFFYQETELYKEYNMSKRVITCRKYKKKMQGLSSLPFPGELGHEIFQNISAKAWEEWKDHQVLLINEKQLNMTSNQDRIYLQNEMKKFLRNEECDRIRGHIPL